MATIFQSNNDNFLTWQKVDGILTLAELQAGGLPEVCDKTIIIAPVLFLTALLESEIELNWIDSDSNLCVTGFEIERSINGGAFSLIHTALATDTTFNDSGLTLNDTVTYRIRTCDGTLKSLYSNEVSFELLLWAFDVGIINADGILYPDHIVETV